MTWISDHLLDFMVNRKAIENEKEVLDFYRYGIEITVSTILSMILIMMLGVLTHMFLYSLTFLVTFVIIRSFVGGFHASTYFKCNMLMLISFLCTSLLTKFLSEKISLTIGIILCIAVLIGMAILGPIENVNKPIPTKRKPKLKFFGVLIGSVFASAGILLIKNNNSLGTMIVFTMILIVILMIAAKIKERK